MCGFLAHLRYRRRGRQRRGAVSASDLIAATASRRRRRRTQVTIAEFQNATYLLVLAGWDDYDDKQLKALVNRLNLAVETRHERKTFFQTQQGPLQEERFNWYKIFVMLDLDGSGRLGYEELLGCIRGGYPCLNLTKKMFSTCWVQGLWKAIDVDRSGDVTVDEFVAFMRRNAPPNPGKVVVRRPPLPMDRQDADLRFPTPCSATLSGREESHYRAIGGLAKCLMRKDLLNQWETTGVGAGAELEVTIPDSIVNGLDPSKVPDHLTYLLREKSYVEEMERKVLADSIAHRKRFMPKPDCGVCSRLLNLQHLPSSMTTAIYPE